MSPSAFSDRLIPALLHLRPLEPRAARALWKGIQLLSLAFAQRLSDLRADEEPLVKARGEIEEKSLIVALLWDVIAILCERLDRIPDRNRPHYSPTARFRILRIKRLLNLSADETAKLFRISTGTIERWQGEMTRADDDTRTIGKTVKPSPPLRRYSDVVEHLCQALALAGLSGHRTIASTLARAGYLVSRSTVRRRQRKPVSLPPDPLAKDRAKRKAVRTVKARQPDHVWMCDLTVIRGLFGLHTFHIAVILDVFSRLPLAAKVYSKAPTGSDLVSLFRSACKTLGPPAYFISDHGMQFTSKAFERALKRNGVKQRFGAVGHSGSIAIIERVWRTLKELLGVRFWKPLLSEDLEKQLAVVLLFYCLRPSAPQQSRWRNAARGLHQSRAGMSLGRPAAAGLGSRCADHRRLPDPPPGPGASAPHPRPRGVAPTSVRRLVSPGAGEPGVAGVCASSVRRAPHRIPCRCHDPN